MNNRRWILVLVFLLYASTTCYAWQFGNATINNATIVNSLTLGGVARTTWPTSLINRRILTSGTTYTPTSTTAAIVIQMVGGGGGGSGVTAAASQFSLGSGGGSGGYAEKYFTNISGNYTYAIGAAGVGGDNNVGGNGGNTTFTGPGNITITAYGGTGGTRIDTGTATANVAGGNGGVLSTYGDINTTGQPGGMAYRISNTTTYMGYSGFGAPSYFGGGGNLKTQATMGDGINASSYGAGGGGAIFSGEGTGDGGNGGQGIIIIWEY